MHKYIPKKIGMNLGTEYLVRSDLIKKFLNLPCSIFVKSNEDRVVVTINKSNNKENTCCVRNWFISSCEENQPIPNMKEYMVECKELNCHPAVILRGFTPIYFNCNSVEHKRNRGNGGHPMPDYLYRSYFNDLLSPIHHYKKKEDFLWSTFVDTYLPSIRYITDRELHYHYFYSKLSKEAIKRRNYDRQQKLTEANFKNTWKSWLKWKKFMLFDTIPGELIFLKDYIIFA